MNKNLLDGITSFAANSRNNGAFTNIFMNPNELMRIVQPQLAQMRNSRQHKESNSKRKKHKQNVFQRIISSLFEAASDMWKHRNSDRHRRDNGNDVSVESKFDRKIKQLYGKKSLVMHDDVDTYFNIDLNERLKGSINSKRDWLIRWEHSIHASIKRALRNTINTQNPIWKYLDQDKAPRFFVRRHKALTSSRNEAQKKRKFRDSKLHSSAGYETKPMKRSTSRIPPPRTASRVQGRPAQRPKFFQGHQKTSEMTSTEKRKSFYKKDQRQVWRQLA